jgi:hypothetical protein
VTELVLATDIDSESRALYLAGRLIGGFDAGYTMYPVYGSLADVLEELFVQPEFAGFEYREENRRMLGMKVNHPLDPDEYDVYWPDKLSEAPVEMVLT